MIKPVVRTILSKRLIGKMKYIINPDKNILIHKDEGKVVRCSVVQANSSISGKCWKIQGQLPVNSQKSGEDFDLLSVILNWFQQVPLLLYPLLQNTHFLKVYMR